MSKRILITFNPFLTKISSKRGIQEFIIDIIEFYQKLTVMTILNVVTPVVFS